MTKVNNNIIKMHNIIDYIIIIDQETDLKILDTRA